MRCLGLSPIGNQCQNTAGEDGVCRRHRGPGKSHLPVPEDLAAEQERQAAERRLGKQEGPSLLFGALGP